MKNLKWIIALLMIGFTLNSCLDDETTQQVDFQYKGIDSIEIGLVKGAREITEIKTFFTAQNTCEDFFDYDYFAIGQERRVTMITAIPFYENCLTTPRKDTAVLNFRPEYPGVYSFKFFKGFDANNSPIYIVEEIVIQ